MEQQIQPLITAIVCLFILLGFTLLGNKFLQTIGKEVLQFFLAFDPVPEPVEDRFPIVYPEAPMHESYHDVLDEIKASKTRTDIKAAFQKVAIFEGTYKDAQEYAHDLWLNYTAQEAYVTSTLN